MTNTEDDAARELMRQQNSINDDADNAGGDTGAPDTDGSGVQKPKSTMPMKIGIGFALFIAAVFLLNAI